MILLRMMRLMGRGRMLIEYATCWRLDTACTCTITGIVFISGRFTSIVESSSVLQ